MKEYVLNTGNYTRVCVDCGAVLLQCGHTKKLCPDCAAARARLQVARALSNTDSARRRLRQRELDARRKSPESLDEVCRAADAAGMSYGTYVAYKLGGR